MTEKKDTTAALVKQERLDVPALLRQAIEGNANVETLERLFALSKEVRAEQARAAWHEAMSAFQEDVPEVVKTKTAQVVTKSGSKYSYRYAPLQDLISIVRPVLAKHGLAVVFKTRVEKGFVTAVCVVGHSAGHTEECEFSVPVDTSSHMNPAQQVASACTYARRYAYLSALGLAPEDDDDGDGAGNRGDPPPMQEPRRKSDPAPGADEAAAIQEYVGGLSAIAVVKGKKPNGTEWTRYDIKCENDLLVATFSATKGTEAQRIATAALVAKIGYVLDPQWGPRLVTLVEVNADEIPF